VSLLKERDCKIEDLTRQLLIETGQAQAILQKMEHKTWEGEKEVNLIQSHVAERDRLLEAKHAEVKALESASSALQAKVLMADQKVQLACDVIARLGQDVMKNSINMEFFCGDIAEYDHSKFKRAIQLFMEKIQQAIHENQSAAVESAIQPFKDELEKVSNVLWHNNSEGENFALYVYDIFSR
jgi:hypothetical protein